MKLSVLRHGETEMQGRFCGRSDPPLMERGWTAMRERCGGRRWDRVVSSPLRRCADFASFFAQDCALETGLSELDFGRWEGRSSKDLWKESESALSLFWQDPDRFPPPEGERWSDFTARVDGAIRGVLFGGAASALLITHAGVMRAMLELYVGIPLAAAWNIALPPASMLEFEFFRDETFGVWRAGLTGLSG